MLQAASGSVFNSVLSVAGVLQAGAKLSVASAPFLQGGVTAESHVQLLLRAHLFYKVA